MTKRNSNKTIDVDKVIELIKSYDGKTIKVKDSAASAINNLYKACKDAEANWRRNKEINQDDINKVKKAFNEVLDYHMDGYGRDKISKQKMNEINKECVNILKKSMDTYQIRSFGW